MKFWRDRCLELSPHGASSFSPGLPRPRGYPGLEREPPTNPTGVPSPCREGTLPRWVDWMSSQSNPRLKDCASLGQIPLAFTHLRSGRVRNFQPWGQSADGSGYSVCEGWQFLKPSDHSAQVELGHFMINDRDPIVAARLSPYSRALGFSAIRD